MKVFAIGIALLVAASPSSGVRRKHEVKKQEDNVQGNRSASPSSVVRRKHEVKKQADNMQGNRSAECTSVCWRKKFWEWGVSLGGGAKCCSPQCQCNCRPDDVGKEPYVCWLGQCFWGL